MAKEYTINGEVYELRKLRDLVRSELAPEWRYLVDYVTPKIEDRTCSMLCALSSGVYLFDVNDEKLRRYFDFLEDRGAIYSDAERYAEIAYPNNVDARNRFVDRVKSDFAPMSDYDLDLIDSLEQLRAVGSLGVAGSFPGVDQDVPGCDQVCELEDNEISNVSSYKFAYETYRDLVEKTGSINNSSSNMTEFYKLFSDLFNSKILSYFNALGYKVYFSKVSGADDAQD